MSHRVLVGGVDLFGQAASGRLAHIGAARDGAAQGRRRWWWFWNTKGAGLHGAGTTLFYDTGRLYIDTHFCFAYFVAFTYIFSRTLFGWKGTRLAVKGWDRVRALLFYDLGSIGLAYLDLRQWGGFSSDMSHVT